MLSLKQIDRIAEAQHALPIVVLAGFALRVIAALVVPDQSATLGDAVAYREAGHSLWATGHLGTPFYMPLYPALVAVTGPGWVQLLIDISLSPATIWLIYELTKQIFGDKRTALVAAAIAAVYPFFIFYSIVGLTETSFMALLVAAYLCWYRNAFVPAAIFSVFAILTRPIFDPLAPILVIYFAFVVSGLSIGGTAKQLAVYAAIYCVMMAPWWAHNYNVYGSFVRLNLGSGLALFSANNPSNLTGGFDTKLNESMAPYNGISDPIARDKALRDAAFSYMKDNPERTLVQASKRFIRFWYPWPYADEYGSVKYKIISLFSFVPVLLMALVYVIFGGHVQFKRIAPLLLFCAYLTSLHMVFPGSLRYRLPLEPFLVILAAAGIIDVKARLQARVVYA